MIDVRAVLQQGPFQLIDDEKVFRSDMATGIFDSRGLDREQGVLVLVRPDQHVANVLPLDAHHELVEVIRGALVEVTTPTTPV